MAKSSTSKKEKTEKESKFAKFSLFFYDRPKLSLVLWLELVVIGVLSFMILLPREGFPPVQFPVGVASGTYFVDDAERVDKDVTQKISDAVESVDEIEQIDTVAGDNFFSVVAAFSDELTSESGTQLLEDTINEANALPPQATIEYTVVNPAQFLNEYDALISVYAESEQGPAELEKAANEVADEFLAYDNIATSEVISQFDVGINPFTGQEETRQTSFGGVALQGEDGEIEFYRATIIGVNRSESADIIDLSDDINLAVAEIGQNPEYSEIGLTIGADFAESINTQIDGLIQNLLTGLLAVVIISFLLITWRASVITAAFMVTVILATMFVLFLVGFTINTITLFALVLSLGLFVDDATIIVEAIDAGRKKGKTARQTVKEAITKIASASFAGTMTTVLVFLPLAFVTGILGEFIRILPLTVIIALLVSLLLSLSLIPFLSKKVLLQNLDKRLKAKPTFINRGESWLAGKMAGFVGLTKRGRGWAIGLSLGMILFSVMFIFASGSLAAQLKFNIFPPTKDADQISVDIQYLPGTTIEEAEVKSVEVGNVIEQTLGENVVRMTFGAFLPATERSSDVLVELVPYTQRDVKSPELVEDLSAALTQVEGVQTRAVQIDSGPPLEQFPFKAQVYNEDPEVALKAAEEIQQSLEGATVERQNGTTATITRTQINFADDQVARKDGLRFVQVEAAYDDTDVTALVVATQEQLEDIYTDERLAELGLTPEQVTYDFGFESDSQDSFSSLLIVGPLALLAMFVLLAIQFRSLVQPLLIFLAIPFSFFGVMLGLNITDNPISFFTMIGFFGLIGISVNNTILMTDYANQERREGKRIIDSISEALRKRFRPLITTSLTTVAALLPLALTDPFWEGLAFTIIFGLLSSTFFVIVSFPFYYLVVEALRVRTKSGVRKLLGRSA